MDQRVANPQIPGEAAQPVRRPDAAVMKYRPEIDGLRAVAVVPVLFFHAGFSFFSGGLVGVDVFFVISGYLITTIIVGELADGRFSIAKFYERRARRILPALFTVMLACLPLAWFLMLPDDLENFGQSLVATALSLNNVLLTMTSGYWDLAAEFKPLLHTWSLGVEEQFYVLFPVAMLAMWPWLGRRSGLVLVLIAIASFLACILTVGRYPSAVFYLLPTRAWELLLGGIAAIHLFRNRQTRSEGLAAAGLLMILASIVLFDAGVPFPSAHALLPTLGTMLIILFAAPSTLTARLLASPVLVGIGLISYSVYLWHQPLFVFTRINSYEEPGTAVLLLMIGLTFILAFLTWHFVERPWRNRSLTPLRLVVPSALAACVATATVGYVLHRAHGYPERFFPSAVDREAGMHIGYNSRVFRYKTGGFIGNGGLKLLVLGDSQARDFINMAEEAGRFDGYDLVYRDDMFICDFPDFDPGLRGLFDQAEHIVVADARIEPSCAGALVSRGLFERNDVIIVGPKHFGYNLNKYAQLPMDLRPHAMIGVFGDVVEKNRALGRLLPRGRYVDILSHLSADGTRMPVFDAGGDILSGDRVHITRAGAVFLGEKIFDDPAWAGLPEPGARRLSDLDIGE